MARRTVTEPDPDQPPAGLKLRRMTRALSHVHQTAKLIIEQAEPLGDGRDAVPAELVEELRLGCAMWDAQDSNAAWAEGGFDDIVAPWDA
jgi:hypothetical protein